MCSRSSTPMDFRGASTSLVTQRLIWLEPQVLASLRALRRPSESYSDVIIRMAAYNEEERSVIEVVQRGRDKPLIKEEIYQSLEQARDLGEMDDSTGARLPLQAR